MGQAIAAQPDPQGVAALAALRDYARALGNERVAFALVEYVDGTFIERKDGETRIGFNGPAATSMPLSRLEGFLEEASE